MSYSETITRNDLKAVLDEVLPVSFSLSSVKEVTLPFTPTSNGLLLVLIRAVNQGRFYVAYSNATPGLVDAYQVASGYTTAVSFVEKGKQVAQTDSINLQQKFFYFVSLGNDSLADYVVEQGTSGTWTYRKWNSGVAECWGEYDKSVTGVSMTAPFSGYNFDLGTIPFPTGLFNAKPVCTVSGRKNGNYTCVSYSNPSSTGISVEFQSSISGTATCEAHIHAIGKWK